MKILKVMFYGKKRNIFLFVFLLYAFMKYQQNKKKVQILFKKTIRNEKILQHL